MSVAAASLVVAIALTAFAGANWLWLRVDADAPRGTSPRSPTGPLSRSRSTRSR